MKHHMRVISLIFGMLLVAPYLILAVGQSSDYRDTQIDVTEHAVVETTESIPETEATEPAVEMTVPVDTSVPENRKPILPEAEEILYEAVEASETPETVPEVDPYDLELLACVIYQEAGGDQSCDECRRRVADVVLNRVANPRFPSTIKRVLTAEGQYGRFHWTGVVWPERAKYDGEQYAVERAYRIAEEVLSGKHSALYGNGYIWQAEFKQGTDIVYCCGHYYGK
jgi:hypothetical protein